MNEDASPTKGQKTKLRILEKALELFGEHGFANTSMQMIASECELSQGAVMQHFPSKGRLLEAVRKQVSISNHNYVDSRIFATDDSFEALRKHLTYNLEWAIKNPAEADVIMLTYETALHDTDYREIAAGAARLGTERIYRYILAAVRENKIKSVADPELTSQIIHEYLLGFILRTLSSTKPSRLTKPMQEKIQLFLGALLSPFLKSIQCI